MKSFSLVLGIYLLWPITNAVALSSRDVAENALPSVAVIEVFDRSRKLTKLGSGFIVADGVVATNHHVVEHGVTVAVRIANSKQVFEVDGFIGCDTTNDVVLLSVPGLKGSPLKLARKDELALGDRIFAIGNPRGFEGTFSSGILSGFRVLKGRKVIQLTAPLSPGSSGGPILNDSGEVVGMAVALIKDGQNLNFAIPGEVILKLVSSSTRPKPLANLPEAAAQPAHHELSPTAKLHFGEVTLDLEMETDEAFQRLREYYFVELVPEDFISHEGSKKKSSGDVYQVFEKAEGRFKLHGFVIADQSGRIHSIQHRIKTSGQENDTNSVVKEFYKLLRKLSTDNELCVVKTTSSNTRTSLGNTSTYTSEFSFQGLKVALSVVEGTGQMASFVELTQTISR